MSDAYHSRHHEQKIIKDADQVETDAIQHGNTIADAGVRDDRIAGAMDDYRTEDPSVIQNEWHAIDIQNDNGAGGPLEEIRRRSEILGSAYPFTINGNRVSYTRSKTGVYEFCLAASTNTTYSGQHAEIPRVFERISAFLIKKYLGHNSLSLNVGTPRSKRVGKRFVDAMAFVNKNTAEWFWSPGEPLPGDPRTTGDEGLDFVVWKKNLDGRAGQLFLIGQCACGDNWEEKFNDLTHTKIGRWFNPISHVPPVRVFSVPHHLSDNNLYLASREAGLVFDRSRLTLLAESYASDPEIRHYSPKLMKTAALVLPLSMAS